MANVELDDSLEKFVTQLVQSGHFTSRTEVLQEGLRLLQLREQNRGAQFTELRRQIQIGLDDLERGEVAPLDMAAIRARSAEKHRVDDNGKRLILVRVLHTAWDFPTLFDID